MSSPVLLRAPMMPLARRVRAYFAPVNRVTEAAAIFDPALHGAFALASPPAPWLDLGWIDNFRRVSATQSEVVSAGAHGAPAAVYRGPLGAEVSFNFREWGKLQMALACGSEQMNALATDVNAAPQPSGGTPKLATAMLTGSTVQELQVGAGAVTGFAVGDLVAVDLDYQQQVGYVGSGIAAAYVRDANDVQHDVDYVRRVTFNVGRVAQITATSLILAQALLGGAPAAGTAIQKVTAFVDREGGAFLQEWSALFLLEEESAGRICFYYPRLMPHRKGSAAAEANLAVAAGLDAIALAASFAALPSTDVHDGQPILCYRSYFPAAAAALY